MSIKRTEVVNKEEELIGGCVAELLSTNID